MSLDAEECASCGSSGVTLKQYSYSTFGRSRRDEKSRALCLLCASTSAGNAQEYPEQYPEQGAILKTICFVGNEILKAIRENR